MLKIHKGFLWLPIEIVARRHNNYVHLWDGGENIHYAWWTGNEDCGHWMGNFSDYWEPKYWTWNRKPRAGQLSEHWQIMESAPRDGTRIRVILSNGEVCAASWEYGSWLRLWGEEPLYWESLTENADV